MRYLATWSLCLLATASHGDVVTEFGMGFKVKASTSQVLWPECTQVLVPHALPLPRAGGLAGCGGDNPVFLGWPVAWESSWKGPWRVRAGWFHLSHWFDGRGAFGDTDSPWEVHSDMLAVTTTFNWTRRRRQ